MGAVLVAPDRDPFAFYFVQFGLSHRTIQKWGIHNRKPLSRCHNSPQTGLKPLPNRPNETFHLLSPFRPNPLGN